MSELAQFDLQDNISYLQQDMVKISSIVERLNVTIDKLADISTSVSSLLAVHENKIATHDLVTKQTLELVEKRRTETDDKMQTLHARISSGEKELSQKIDGQYDQIISDLKEMRAESAAQHTKLSDRITYMEKWIWAVIGGSGVIGALLTIVLKFTPLL